MSCTPGNTRTNCRDSISHSMCDRGGPKTQTSISPPFAHAPACPDAGAARHVAQLYPIFRQMQVTSLLLSRRESRPSPQGIVEGNGEHTHALAADISRARASVILSGTIALALRRAVQVSLYVRTTQRSSRWRSLWRLTTNATKLIVRKIFVGRFSATPS